MDGLTGMTFHSAEREVERLERQLEDMQAAARRERDDLRRQIIYGNVARELAAREAARAEAESWNIAMEELSALLDSARVETADLRRQLEQAQGDREEALRALDIVIAERDEAHNEIDDLRRQLAAAQETIAALRLRLSLDNPAYRPAPGEGE